MSDRIGRMRQEFEQNFDLDALKNTQTADENTDDGGKGKNVKGKKGSSGLGGTENVGATQNATYIPGPGDSNSSATPVQVLVMQCMLDAYNTNTYDIETKGQNMQAVTAVAADLSQASATITSAQLNSPSSVTIDIADSTHAAGTVDGSTAYISQQQYDEMQANGLTIPTGKAQGTTALSSLISNINNIQETLNGNTEYTMLQLQTDTQNQTQDSSMASGTLKSIGDSISGVARNIGG